MSSSPLKVLPRSTWDARPPLKTTPMAHPFELVDISYTDPRNILDTATIKDMQKLHMDGLKMDDIKCNFIVGRDGAVYEGRGWLSRPHESDYVDVGDEYLDILIIVNWKGGKPDPCILKALNSLFELGRQLNYMGEHYLVIGRTKEGLGKVDGDPLLRKKSINI